MKMYLCTLVVSVLALGAIVTGEVAGAGQDDVLRVQAGSVPTVPGSLRVPGTQALSLQTHAIGVQIYDCKPARDDPSRFEFVFRAPEADLFDAAGRKMGKHYAGPTWESNDGSTVVGEVKARDDGPDANAIPWLLLSAKATSGGGIFGQTVSVQRVQTVGGKAPANGCNEAQSGQVVRVPYSATYYFYVARPWAGHQTGDMFEHRPAAALQGRLWPVTSR